MAWNEQAAVLRPPALPDRPSAPPARPRAKLTTAPPLLALEQIAGMVMLGIRATVATVTPPFSWRDDFIEQTWLIIRRSLIPVIVSTTALGFGLPGIQGGSVLTMFGSVDRLGAFFVMASVREIAPWVNAMVIAGVGGTAICADLGARKVRQELDALAVLGLDPVREVVAPRFLALGLVTALMSMVAVLFGVVGGWIAAVPFYGEATAGYVSTFDSNFVIPELVGFLIKISVYGFLIATVCCYKGMHVKGGAEGVGRAVNQAVVIAFVAIWAFNFIITSTMLSGYPDTVNLH